MSAPVPPLSSALREAVQPAHRRIEELPFFRALAARALPGERYVDQLRAMAVVTAALERAAELSGEPAVRAAAAQAPPRLGSLLGDLSHFDRNGLCPDDPAAAAAAVELAGGLLLAGQRAPAALLGPLHVLRGTALGNRVHLDDARAAAGGEEGTSWYAGGGPAVGAAFRASCAALDAAAAALDGEAREAAVAAAVAAVEGLERLHRLLDPGVRPARRFLATTFNPEAGTHEVPQDPAEAAAAVRAGDRCLDGWPCFLERWGERRRRFARSDAAWLASLARLDREDALGQVRWLAGVLARRGMPTLLLERQLGLLAEEFGSIGPSSHPELLCGAARMLAARREAALPAGSVTAAVDRFVSSAGHRTEAERWQAAHLLVAAAADEASGLAGTVDAVASWYRGGRFPASFTGAMDALLEDAGAAARPAVPGTARR